LGFVMALALEKVNFTQTHCPDIKITAPTPNK
jgi:hypothetical protein